MEVVEIIGNWGFTANSAVY